MLAPAPATLALPWLLGAALLLPGCTPRPGPEWTEATCSVSAGACVPLAKGELEADPLLRHAVAALRCEAVAGVQLDLADDGARSWLVVRSEGKATSLEEDIVYRDTPGNFANVLEAPPPRLLLDRASRPQGLVFAVSYQPEDAGASDANLVQFHAYALGATGASLVHEGETEAEALEALKNALGTTPHAG